MQTELKPHASLAAPTITRVEDSKGTSIPNPGNTEDSLLTLSGTADLNSVVSLYDHSMRVGTASVVKPGVWKISPLAAAVGPHSFTIRAPDGASSVPWVVTVGAVELDLLKPAVAQAPGGILDPMDVISGATVVVTYDMLPTDSIGLSWNGLDSLVPSQPGSTLGSVTFTVPDSAVAAVIGKTIPVLYAVVRDGVAKPSEVLDLTVQTLAESVLEAPRILQAADDLSLDVSALTGDADLAVRPWPLIAVGQQISLRFEGVHAEGSAHNWAHPTWQNLPISSAGEPTTNVALANLEALKDESDLKLIFEVSFDEGVTKVAFPVRTYAVQNVREIPIVDPLPVTLAGQVFFFAGHAAAPLIWPEGTSITKPPSGGLAPYTYVSSDPVVAAVDRQGLVTARGNGSAIITTTDALGVSGSYNVYVTGVAIIYFVVDRAQPYPACLEIAQSQGLAIPTLAEMQAIHGMYLSTAPVRAMWYWTSTPHSLPETNYTINMHTGELGHNHIITAPSSALGLF